MAVQRTEEQHPNAVGLDEQPPLRILRLLADAQFEAAHAVEAAFGPIAEAAQCVAETLRAGGRLAYAAAGSSGLMALADALELPGTFGIHRQRIVVMIAGGTRALLNLAGAPEDDADEARRAVEAVGIGAGDCLIAVSASGSTPYAVAALQAAAARGARTIGIACNAATPLVAPADVRIVLATPPELVAGSTRMGAGTAQKIALNMISTLAAIHLGHVHDGQMVNLDADNQKLRQRAARIVAAIGGCGTEEALGFLDLAGGRVKVAALLAAGAPDVGAAQASLHAAGGRLRLALGEITGNDRSRNHGT